MHNSIIDRLWFAPFFIAILLVFFTFYIFKNDLHPHVNKLKIIYVKILLLSYAFLTALIVPIYFLWEDNNFLDAYIKEKIQVDLKTLGNEHPSLDIKKINDIKAIGGTPVFRQYYVTTQSNNETNNFLVWINAPLYYFQINNENIYIVSIEELESNAIYINDRIE